MLIRSRFLAVAAVASIAAAGLAVVARSSAHDAAKPVQADDEAAFLAENNAAMSKMMAAMAIKPAGDVDTDFVASMVPHHQGAIAMAQAELRYGRNERLRRIAQEIIIGQTQEIAAMQQALAE